VMDARHVSIACPHNKTHAPITEITFDALLEAYRCVETLFATHHPGPWHEPSKYQAHVCHVSRCPMVQHRQIYVCLNSGNYHLCGEYTCRFGSDQEARMACPVTDCSFSAETTQQFTWGYSDGVRSDEQIRSTQYKDKHRRPTLLQMDRRTRTAQSLVRASPASALAPQRPEDRAMDERLTARKVAAFVGPTKSFAQTPLSVRAEQESDRVPIVDEQRLLALGREIEAVYRLLLAASTPPSTYTYDYHVFLVLSLMGSNGAQYKNRVTYVTAHDDVRRAMPLFDDALLLAGTNRRTYSNMCKVFTRGMSQHFARTLGN